MVSHAQREPALQRDFHVHDTGTMLADGDSRIPAKNDGYLPEAWCERKNTFQRLPHSREYFMCERVVTGSLHHDADK